MSENVKVKEVVRYGGHSKSASGAVNLTFVASYSELVKTIQVMQMLNNDVTIKAKVPDQKPMILGSFRVKHIDIDDDGESKLKFNGIDDFVEMDNLNSLPKRGDDVTEFQIMMEAEIETEDDDDVIEVD